MISREEAAEECHPAGALGSGEVDGLAGGHLGSAGLVEGGNVPASTTVAEEAEDEAQRGDVGFRMRHHVLEFFLELEDRFTGEVPCLPGGVFGGEWLPPGVAPEGALGVELLSFHLDEVGGDRAERRRPVGDSFDASLDSAFKLHLAEDGDFEFYFGVKGTHRISTQRHRGLELVIHAEGGGGLVKLAGGALEGWEGMGDLSGAGTGSGEIGNSREGGLSGGEVIEKSAGGFEFRGDGSGAAGLGGLTGEHLAPHTQGDEAGGNGLQQEQRLRVLRVDREGITAGELGVDLGVCLGDPRGDLRRCGLRGVSGSPIGGGDMSGDLGGGRVGHG